MSFRAVAYTLEKKVQKKLHNLEGTEEENK
jgi:hypothetical protein